MTRPRQKTRADLLRENMELRAQLASTYAFAEAEVERTKDMSGSGIIMTLTALGGREVMRPVMIRDGLSVSTIIAKVEIQQTIWPGKPGGRIEMIGCADRRDEATP